jgi:hypothetical protein
MINQTPPLFQSTENEPEVSLSLKLSQVNIVIAGLDELPHKYSRPIIDLIGQQTQQQMQQNQSIPTGPLSPKIIK